MRFFFTLLSLSAIILVLAACGGSTPAPEATLRAPLQLPTLTPRPVVVTATPEPPTPSQPTAAAQPTTVALNAPTNTPPAETPIPVAPVTTDSPLIGTYSAILPAADAPGRIVTLDLALDGTATMTTQFIGKGAPVVESGTWVERNDSASVTFTLRDGQAQDNRITWQLQDNQLVTTVYDQAQYGAAGLPLERVGTGIANQANYAGVSFSFDTMLAQSAQGATLPAVPADNNAPALGGGAPARIRFLFDNAQAQDFFDPRLPQVYVYSVADLKNLDPSVAKNVESLQKILADKQVAPGQTIPVFPIIPASQVFRTQVHLLDFVNGSGVSFVTYYAQDASPATADRIFYTFQGITLDGEWYVAAYWDVTTPALPADANAAQNVLPPTADAKQFEQYLAQTVATLDSLPPAGFAPNLTLLNNMVQSINATPELQSSTAPTPQATSASSQGGATQTVNAEYNGASLNFSSALAQSAQGVTIPAVPVDQNAPGLGGGAPEHIAFGFNGETVTADVDPFQPAVRIYPTEGLKALDPAIAQQIVALKTLLAAKPPTLDQHIPVFPSFNAEQVIHPQIKYLNFKNGAGIRFVTFYAQAYLPITNDGLFFTFQGLTADGKYYVTVFWPLRTDQLPNTYQDANIKDYDAFIKQAEQYYVDTAKMLNELPPDAFSPGLALLDQMIESVQTPP
ncbi:MAG: copper resistance protein NlpE N-terminal domain-containing protein [Chloroflexi bacterium]|nr:copper resistance protein NlpE N-terminal domain-containing protein [Chloroflexota bacterium]